MRRKGLMYFIDRLKTWFLVALIYVPYTAAVSVILAVPVYYLWNWLVPEVFGWKAITFFQAWGLLILSLILVKNNDLEKGPPPKP